MFSLNPFPISWDKGCAGPIWRRARRSWPHRGEFATSVRPFAEVADTPEPTGSRQGRGLGLSADPLPDFYRAFVTPATIAESLTKTTTWQPRSSATTYKAGAARS